MKKSHMKWIVHSCYIDIYNIGFQGMLEISELPDIEEINEIIQEHDLLLAVNGKLCCCFNLSFPRDRWVSMFSLLKYPAIFTFFRIATDGDHYFIPKKVFLLCKGDI